VFDTMDAVLGGALLDARFAGVGIDLDVLGHDGTEQLRRLLTLQAALDRVKQQPCRLDHAGKLLLSRLGIGPVIAGLASLV